LIVFQLAIFLQLQHFLLLFPGCCCHVSLSLDTIAWEECHLILKVEGSDSSETLVSTDKTIWHKYSEGQYLNMHHHENLISYHLKTSVCPCICISMIAHSRCSSTSSSIFFLDFYIYIYIYIWIHTIHFIRSLLYILEP
jgi:hypothetical protein